MSDTSKNATKVLYNADCPVCSFEIDHYARIGSKHDLPLIFDDLNDGTALAKWGIDQDSAAKRLHVLKNGEVHSGIPAFIILWREMPGYRWLAQFANVPGVHRAAVWTYDRVLAPALYRWHLLRNRRKTTT